MDGRGAWLDSVFVERVWRSVKYKRVCLNAYSSDATYCMRQLNTPLVTKSFTRETLTLVRLNNAKQ